jgi:hypothetical protein
MRLIKKIQFKGNKEYILQYIDEKGIQEAKGKLTDDAMSTVMGCYIVNIRMFEKDAELKRLENLIDFAKEDLQRFIELTRYGKAPIEWSLEDQDVQSMKTDFVRYLERRKKRIEEAGDFFDDAEILYDKCTLTIKWKANGEKKVRISVEDVKEIILPSMELIIIKK